MALGVPVLARNIPGNSALIKHRETGLLFNTPEVCTIEISDCCFLRCRVIKSQRDLDCR